MGIDLGGNIRDMAKGERLFFLKMQNCTGSSDIREI